MDVAEFALSVEDFLTPFPGETEGFGEGSEELDDLRDVVVVFAVLGARLGIEEVIARYELEYLFFSLVPVVPPVSRAPLVTMKLGREGDGIPWQPYSRHLC